MARAWRLWEPHQREDSAVLECVSVHEKRRKVGGRCCWVVGFWGVVLGGACVGIGPVCMYCTEYLSNNHPVLPHPQPTHLSVIGTHIHCLESPQVTSILSTNTNFTFETNLIFVSRISILTRVTRRRSSKLTNRNSSIGKKQEKQRP